MLDLYRTPDRSGIGRTTGLLGKGWVVRMLKE
jgi:hypothetical protein